MTDKTLSRVAKLVEKLDSVLSDEYPGDPYSEAVRDLLARIEADLRELQDSGEDRVTRAWPGHSSSSRRVGAWAENLAPRRTAVLRFYVRGEYDHTQWVLSLSDGPFVVIAVSWFQGKNLADGCTVVDVTVWNDSDEYVDLAALMTRSGEWNDECVKCALRYAPSEGT